MNALKARIIKIGNSRGIRIPKSLIGLARPGDEVTIMVQPGQLIVRFTSHPRQGWDEQFRLMAERGDDHLLDKPTRTHWDTRGWKW